MLIDPTYKQYIDWREQLIMFDLTAFPRTRKSNNNDFQIAAFQNQQVNKIFQFKWEIFEVFNEAIILKS
jgi:hypothetical protein